MTLLISLILIQLMSVSSLKQRCQTTGCYEISILCLRGQNYSLSFFNATWYISLEEYIQRIWSFDFLTIFKGFQAISFSISSARSCHSLVTRFGTNYGNKLTWFVDITSHFILFWDKLQKLRSTHSCRGCISCGTFVGRHCLQAMLIVFILIIYHIF